MIKGAFKAWSPLIWKSDASSSVIIVETCCEVKEAVPEDTIIIHIPVYLQYVEHIQQPAPSAYKGDHNTNMLNDEEDNPCNFHTGPAEIKGPDSCQSSALWTSCCSSH